MKRKQLIITSTIVILITIGLLVVFAYSKTWGKVDVAINIHINEKLVQESAFGESPTFAIWIENPKTHETKTIFVTRRVAENDWEGKAEVPVALPAWGYIKKENKQKTEDEQEKNHDFITISGATPKPGYFAASMSVKQNSEWILWIEVNLAGDFNEHYMEFDKKLNVADKFATGQPAIVYKTKITAIIGTTTVPKPVGLSMQGSNLDDIINPLSGITTATNIFDEISLHVVKTKPRIITSNFTKTNIKSFLSTHIFNKN